MKSSIIVCGYGIVDDKIRSETEMLGLYEYYNASVQSSLRAISKT
jgi:hypothetical protein